MILIGDSFHFVFIKADNILGKNARANLGSLHANMSNISTTTLSAEGASYPVDLRLSYISEEEKRMKEGGRGRRGMVKGKDEEGGRGRRGMVKEIDKEGGRGRRGMVKREKGWGREK